MTARKEYENLEQVRERLIELLHYHKSRLAYRKRTELAVEIVQQLEEEGEFPGVPYAFDQGVLSHPLTQAIEQAGKHWVSEIECSRNILWQGKWQRIDGVAKRLKTEHPESFRHKRVRCRNGKTKEIWAFTKVVRLKKYGRKRVVVIHEKAELSDEPRFLITDALHWDSSHVMQTWSYRWPVETFHEFSKQFTGLESAQLRKEEGVKRHFCLSCVAQSVLQQAKSAGGKSEKFNFARDNEQSIGQKLYQITRESVQQLVELTQELFAQGSCVEQVMEVIMPA